MQDAADWLQKRLDMLWRMERDEERMADTGPQVCELALVDVQALDNKCRAIREELRAYRSALSKYQRSAKKARLSRAARQRVGKP